MKVFQTFVVICVLLGITMCESPPQYIWSMDQYNSIGGDSKPVIMFVGKSDDNYKKYTEVSKELQEYDEVIMTAVNYEKADKIFIEALELKEPTDGYYIVARYPKGLQKTYYEYSIDNKNLETFVIYKSMKNYESNTLNQMTKEDIQLIKTLHKAAFIFFSGKTLTEKSLAIIEQCLHDVTSLIIYFNYKNCNILAFKTDFTSPAGTELSTTLEIKMEDEPQLWIVDYSEGFDRPSKYKFEFETFQMNYVFEFMRLYRNRQLSRHLVSQKVEASKYENNVMVLSSDIFNLIVNDKSKEVVVFYYRDNCPPCEQILSTYEKAAKKFTGDTSIIFSKINLSKNDLQINPQSPSIKFYTSHFKAGFDFNDKLENLPLFVLDYRTLDKSKNSRDSY